MNDISTHKVRLPLSPSPLERVGERSLLITSDGSHTLFVKEIDESYHSTHGAIQESQHIFIESGLKQCKKPEISVLEIGFGTGLNAFLALLEAENKEKTIDYITLERYPIEIETAFKLNYPKQIDIKKQALFEALHKAKWNDKTTITRNFTLTKVLTDFTQYSFCSNFDVVFFDAFSPEKQPEMWTQELFTNIFNRCNPNAVLTTYCAKGIVRRNLQNAGFVVERLPGPPGKREILRAKKV
jgi:tRNA U34 5-methylaminomethyl-2-thiouridine-forming methyltransferase MnmC